MVLSKETKQFHRERLHKMYFTEEAKQLPKYFIQLLNRPTDVFETLVSVRPKSNNDYKSYLV